MSARHRVRETRPPADWRDRLDVARLPWVPVALAVAVAAALWLPAVLLLTTPGWVR